MDAESETESMKALQAEIYRGKVLRARAMTASERLAEALELSNDIYAWMLDGAMAQCGLRSAEEGWVEVEHRLKTLRRLQGSSTREKTCPNEEENHG